MWISSESTAIIDPMSDTKISTKDSPTLLGSILEVIQDNAKVTELLPLLSKLEKDSYEKGRKSARDEIKQMHQQSMNPQETLLAMVIDDNEEILAFLSQIMTKGGYQVIAGKSGQECMQLLQTNKPDILVLDINLQDGSGEDICDEIRQQYETRYLPVVFISGLIDPVESEKLNKAEESIRNGKRFLSKPLDIPKLFNILEEIRQAQRIAGELPWTPPLPREIDFAKIPIRALKEYHDGQKETRSITLSGRIQEYVDEGYFPEDVEYIVVELLSRAKVRVDMDGFVERLSLEDLDHHMITAYAAELYNRYYPRRVVPVYRLQNPIKKAVFPVKNAQTQKINLKIVGK